MTLKIMGMLQYLQIFCLIAFSSVAFTQISNRQWSTYHGGNSDDNFRDMAIDAAGNVFVIGSTLSPNAIATTGSYQPNLAGASDVFVAKYDKDGNKIWSTYFGGSEDDFGQSIDLDAVGNVFITGLTFSTTGIATSGTHQSNNNGNGDTFIAKFSNNGMRIWGSYLGGEKFDYSNDIELDIAGNPIILGWTNSVTNISTTGAFSTTYNGQNDVLLAKFNTNGQLLWSTYFGDVGFDTGLQVESDGLSNIVISGWTSSTVNIVTPGAIQSTYGGNTADVFLAVFSGNGNRLWSTYYGGSGNDYGDALYVNSMGDIYLSGSTSSPNNIATPSALQSNLAVGYDAFLTKFAIDGTRNWATYFGGNGDDTAYRLRESSNGGIFMVGHTTSSNVMATTGAFQQVKSGGQDVFIARFEKNGTRAWSTYYGGASNDFGLGLVLDVNNDIYINGTTEGSTNLSTLAAPQINYGGGTKDGFVSKFSPCVAPILNFTNSGYTCSPVNYVFEFELIGQPPFSIFYSIDGIAQPPWTTNNTNFFPTVNASQWNKTIQIDSVKNNNCKGTINSAFGFVQVRDSIRATEPIITCDQATSTYTVMVDLSGGAFGGFASIGTTGGSINSTTDRFVSFPIPFAQPYHVQFTEAGTFSDCDTLSFKGISGCSNPCPPFIPIITSNSPVCSGSSLFIMAESNLNYEWQGPNGFAFNGQNITINNVTPMNAGTYTVTATDSNGCTSISSLIVVINLPSSGSISSNSPVCFGNSIELAVTGGTQYNWTGPNNFTSTDDNPIIPNASNINAGDYIVTVSDVQGCTRVVSVTVNVTNQIIVQSNSNSPLCTGATLNLTASGGVSYAWSGPNGFTNNIQNPTINNATILNAGTYIVTVTAANNCTATSSVQVIINDLSNVMITTNSNVCLGNTINLMASNGIAYQWSGPNGFTNMTQNPVINNATLLNSGLYSVTVTAAGGCTGMANMNVVVNSLPLVNSTSNGPLCEGNIINLSVNGGVAFNWSGPNGFTNNVQNPTINNASSLNAGVYTVTVTDTNGCSASTSTNVVVNPKPTAILSSNSPVCNGGDISFQLSGGMSYNWQGPNGFVSMVQNPVVTNASAVNSGTYTVEVTNQNGCISNASTPVIVTGQLSVDLTSNSPICENDTLRLMANAGLTFVWNGPNGFTATVQNPTIPSANLSATGNYILTVSDVSGCTGTRQINVVITQNPVAIITGDQNICQGEPLILNTPSLGILNWSTNEVGTSITVAPSLNTTYTLIADLSGCKDTTSFDVIVSPKPNITINVNNPIITLGQSIQLMASGGLDYIWTPSIGLSCADCPDPIATPSATTTYCVMLSLDGCLADTCVNITVRDNCQLIFPNIFSPNGDGINDIWCSKAQDCIGVQSLAIYDRWGNLLHNQTGTEVCWDGGTNFQNNVYTYLLNIVKSDGKTVNLTGTITLVR
ncbi:MAG: SBBP repeat-containing protein [Saprospiraceae bacterium]|nr:SBBP repeat-containing protein [Saprospiraceae bacterium]